MTRRNIRHFNPQYQRNYRNDRRGRGYTNRNIGRGRGRGGRGPNPDRQCPLHPFSNHTWRRCFENQRGEQFKPYQGNNQQKINGNVHFNQDIIDKDNQEHELKGRIEYEEKSNGNNSWKGILCNH